MRISDWSADVCSSDLNGPEQGVGAIPQENAEAGEGKANQNGRRRRARAEAVMAGYAARAVTHRIAAERCGNQVDRKRVVLGKSVSVRVDLGGRRLIKTKKTNTITAKQGHRKYK